jgi:hypothetical protein
VITFLDWGDEVSEDGTTLSHLHFVAGTGDWDYVNRKLLEKPELLYTKDDMSLILSAATSWHVSPVLKGVLDLGASPNERVNIDYRDYHSSASVSMIFCTYFAARMVERRRDSAVSKHCGRLECFLPPELLMQMF